MAEALVAGQADLYAAGMLGCACGHQRATATARGARAADGNGGTVTTPARLPGDGWPFWRRVYAAGDPLPRFTRATAPAQRFDEGDPLPPEYRDLLLKMLRHEGERAGNKSFLGFMATCADVAETLYPTAAARLIKAEYLAEELKHAIMFHRLAVGLDPDFALKDVPYAHYTFHLPRESWADDALFHFLVDLNGAFHARDWRDSSYAPLAEMSSTVERDELGHSEMGYRFARLARGQPLGIGHERLPHALAVCEVVVRADVDHLVRLADHRLPEADHRDAVLLEELHRDVGEAALQVRHPAGHDVVRAVFVDHRASLAAALPRGGARGDVMVAEPAVRRNRSGGVGDRAEGVVELHREAGRAEAALVAREHAPHGGRDALRTLRGSQPRGAKAVETSLVQSLAGEAPREGLARPQLLAAHHARLGSRARAGHPLAILARTSLSSKVSTCQNC